MFIGCTAPRKKKNLLERPDCRWLHKQTPVQLQVTLRIAFLITSLLSLSPGTAAPPAVSSSVSSAGTVATTERLRLLPSTLHLRPGPQALPHETPTSTCVQNREWQFYTGGVISTVTPLFPLCRDCAIFLNIDSIDTKVKMISRKLHFLL